MTETKHSIWTRLYRGETAFDFVGRRNRWFVISGTVILIGLVSLFVRGLNFSIDFKGGTVWEVQSNATVAHARDVISSVSPELRQATIEVLTNHATGVHTLRISADAVATTDSTKVQQVSTKLAQMAGVDVNQVILNDVGPTWGHDITQKAERALVFFLIVVVIYITFRFEGKMAIAALVALVHDILVTVGVYSLSGFQVSPATVIAFLTILGYSLYDTIVVFDKVEENTKGLASSGRITYTETVNLSMNQVLMRSINTSIVAIMPILSILLIGSFLLGASALQDFGLALFIGLLTGAYSSIFIAAPLLAVMKEREPRYSQIRQRLANRASMTGVLTPAAAASGELLSTGAGGGGGGGGRKTSGATRPAGKAGSGTGSPKTGVLSPSSKGAATSSSKGAAVPAVSPADEDQDHYEGPVRPKSADAGANGAPARVPAKKATAAAEPDDDGADSAPAAVPAPRPAAPKPRPGAANRSGGPGGNRPPPRPRKKGKRR